MSAYGYGRSTTPELDTFAAGSTVFERAVSPAQWTIPAHASLFTGLYPTTHQLTEANRQLPQDFPTLAELLQANGYRTAGFCNNPLLGMINHGLQRGFDDFYNYAGVTANRPVLTRRSGLTRALSDQWHHLVRAVSQNFAHNDQLFRVALHPLITPLWTRAINFKGHTGHSVDDVMAYMRHYRAQSPERPTFTFVNLMGAHLPYNPTDDALGRVAPHVRRDRAARRFMTEFNADAARWASPMDAPLVDWQRRAIDDYYDAEIAAQDYHLGRLLRWLRKSGALEDTLVIVAADHGEGHGDHDFFGHGFVVYQELVHVPLIVHYPEHFPAGHRVKTNVSTRRIYHTVLDAAGIAPPVSETHPNANIHGLSLARATNCKPDTENDIAYAEAFPPQTFLSVLKHRSPHLIERLNLRHVRRGVYHGERKLAMVGSEVEGFYDVTQDPQETRDIAPQHTAEVSAMQTRLVDFVQSARTLRAGGVLQTAISDEMAANMRALGYME
jgi:uncharacterized sulfatase